MSDLESIGVTATRRVFEAEPGITLTLIDLPRSRFIVGACWGGDCLVASEAIRLGHEVHTVVPGVLNQVCVHWRTYLNQKLALIAFPPPPHSTTWEQMSRDVRGTASDLYRARNERIVQLSDRRVLAWPNHKEQEVYSGVTMTINIARRAGKTVDVHVLHPREVPV